MSVPAFIDISEEDQAAELRAYLKSKGAEISEENSEGGLHVDLAQIIEACDVCLKEDDKDVESVMNSVVSLLLILEPDKQEALIESLCEKLVKFREGLLHEQNMAKMRLLTFMGMAVENKEISFDTMQQELQIGADDVEAFVIDAVRTKMVYCKIDQTQRKVVVSHSTHRTFGKQQWQQLYDTLNAWKQNLNKVKNSLLSLSDT
ncbi:hypothetical protein CB1_056579038 [Camelus ferus]|nr:hypothetical protein CB1_056579038 [Camelus ferus]